MNEPINPMTGKDFSFLKNKKIAFIFHLDIALLTHRLPLVEHAMKHGAEVYVLAGDTGRGKIIRNLGINFIPLEISPNGMNPLDDLRTVRQIYLHLNRIRPDLVHNVSIKPVLYGSIVSRFFGKWPVVNAVSGLGFTFSADGKAKIIKKLLSPLFRCAMGFTKSVTIFQNTSDMQTMLSAGFLKNEQAKLIKGSGVNCSRFKPSPFPQSPVVMLPARLLWDKGVGEFIDAAKIVHDKFPEVKFVLVGQADHDNPKAIARNQVLEWISSMPYLEWWGEKEPDKMAEVISRSTIVVLPSYHEGLPKVLLEAAASGRPVIGTDIPGCRPIVRDRVNGYLVPVKNPEKLAEAIIDLLQDPEKINLFGKAGRAIVCEEFSEEKIVAETLEIYREILGYSDPKRSVN
jgi:glycosyltransferase involved in cell wall biosynthesis